MIPGFCLFGLFWSVCHVVLLITVWGFHTKLSECQKAWRAQRSDGRGRSLDQVMASRGIRHFCLISERLVLFGVLSTAVLGAVSWQVGGGGWGEGGGGQCLSRVLKTLKPDTRGGVSSS